MTSQAEPPRYEVKIPCEPHCLPEVQAWVQLHPVHWHVAYPPRQVNNIYFDTTDCRSLNENLAGICDRGKLRLRWYGPRLDVVDNACLELKYREGSVSRKVIWPLNLTLDLARTSWPKIQQMLCKSAAPEARLWLAQLPQPVLVNHYQRAYYTTPDQAARLTIDTGLCAYDQRFSDHPNLSRPAPISDRIVIEIKATADNASCERLSEALNRFPLRPDRHSKYVQGMLAAPGFDGVDLA